MKLSVIIPVYNKKRYLSGLLEQLRAQTFTDFECLLIDDGSTDGSGAVCDEFAAKDTRLRVFHIPNGGVSHARNVGLDHARGEYVTFIDADDRIHVDLLEKLYRHAETSGASMVIGNLQKVWDDRPDTDALPIPYLGCYSMAELLPDFARMQQETGIYGFCVAKLLPRELIADTRFDPRVRLAEDLNFYLDIYPRVDTICFDPKPHYDYLQAAENSSMLDADDKIDYFTQLNIQHKLLRFLQEHEALHGENRRIMIARIYDYVFFALFHCRLKNYCQLSAQIRSLDLPPRVPDPQEVPLRRVLLFLYARRLDRLAMCVLKSYRSAGRAVRMIRRRSVLSCPSRKN